MQLSITHARQWLVHGSSDDVVPPDFSRDYVAAKQKRTGKDKEDAHLLEIAGAGHFDVIDPRTEACKRIEEIALQLAS
jgi:pimeloyl-ACP methyl ester carboxylesterase